MQRQPLPIPGLPVSSPVRGLTVLDDVLHVTSSHARPPITPIPAWHAATAEHPVGRRPRWERSGEDGTARRQRNWATRDDDEMDFHDMDLGHYSTFFPSRHFRGDIPDRLPVRPEASGTHLDPVAICQPWDVLRFFPFTIGLAATLAAVSGLLAGLLANRVLGSTASPLLFMAGYLAFFAINLSAHCFSTRGQPSFVSKQRFFRLLLVNFAILVPHLTACFVLTGIAK